MALLAQSAKSLQKLVTICEKYGLEHNITFNTKKSYCMYISYNKKGMKILPSIFLNGKKLEYVDKIKYLGVIITSDFRDDDDMQRQLAAINIRNNVLIRKFNMCSFNVKKVLYKSFCCNLYCSFLWWHNTNQSEKKLRIACNKGLRRFLGYDTMYSARSMFVENYIDSYMMLYIESTCINFIADVSM